MSEALGRRRFIAGAGLVAGAAFVSGIAPFGSARSQPRPALRGTGHVDDACGHWPPYSHPIPYGHVPPSGAAWAHWDPIDHIFMI
jgi:hypothetical protein